MTVKKTTRTKTKLKSPTPLLPLSEIQEMMAHFSECQAEVLREQIPDDRTTIQKWIDKTVLLMQPVYTLRRDALEELNGSIYNTEAIREFVFDLGFLFFSTWGIQNGPRRLSANLVEGLSLDGPDENLSSIPVRIRASMQLAALPASIEKPSVLRRWLYREKMPTLEDFLSNNKQLLVVYLLRLTNNTVVPDPAP